MIISDKNTNLIFDKLVNYFVEHIFPFMESKGFFHSVEENKQCWTLTQSCNTQKIALELIHKPELHKINFSLGQSDIYIEVTCGIHYHFSGDDIHVSNINQFHKLDWIGFDESRNYWPVPINNEEFDKVMSHLLDRIKSRVLPWFDTKCDMNKEMKELECFIQTQLDRGISNAQLYKEYYLIGCMAEKLGQIQKSRDYKYITHKLKSK